MSLLFIIDTQLIGYPSCEKGCSGVHVEGEGGRRTMTSEFFTDEGVRHEVATQTTKFEGSAKSKEAFVCEVVPVVGWEGCFPIVGCGSFAELGSDRSDPLDQLHAFRCLDWVNHVDSSIVGRRPE